MRSNVLSVSYQAPQPSELITTSVRITESSSLLARPGNTAKHKKGYLNEKVSVANQVDFQNPDIKMQYSVRAVFHLAQGSSSDNGHRTLFRESRSVCSPAVRIHCSYFPGIPNHEIRNARGTFLPVPSSICPWTCCPWGFCPGECGNRKEKEVEEFMEHKEV